MTLPEGAEHSTKGPVKAQKTTPARDTNMHQSTGFGEYEMECLVGIRGSSLQRACQIKLEEIRQMQISFLERLGAWGR